MGNGLVTPWVARAATSACGTPRAANDVVIGSPNVAVEPQRPASHSLGGLVISLLYPSQVLVQCGRRLETEQTASMEILLTSGEFGSDAVRTAGCA